MLRKFTRRSKLRLSDEVGRRVGDKRARCLEELSQLVLREPSDPPAEDARTARLWEELERLDQLVQLRSSIWQRKASLLIVPGFLVLGFVVASWLLADRIGSTDVEIDAGCQEVSFVPADTTLLTDPIATSSLIYRGDLAVARAAATQHCQSLELTNTSGDNPTLDVLEVAAGSLVDLESDTTATQISIAGAGEMHPSASASVTPGTVASDCVEGNVDRFDSIDVTSTGPLTMVVRADEKSHAIHSQGPFMVSRLELAHSRDYERGKPVLQSSLSSGTLFLEELGDAKRELREGQILRFDIVDRGTIEMLKLEHSTWTIRFRGTVKNLRIRSGNRDVSLMPTRLVWMTAQPDLGRWYSSAIALFLALLAVHRWWRKRE
jgi:hypothetical protein